MPLLTKQEPLMTCKSTLESEEEEPKELQARHNNSNTVYPLQVNMARQLNAQVRVKHYNRMTKTRDSMYSKLSATHQDPFIRTHRPRVTRTDKVLGTPKG